MALSAFVAGLAHAAPPPFVKEGRAGFVVSHIEYALAEDTEKTGACPDGVSSSAQETFQQTAEGKRRPGESDDSYERRLRQAGRELAVTPDGYDVCMNPEKAPADPHFRTVQGRDIPVGGIPLNAPWDAATDPEARPTFPALNGNLRVENQFYRVVGCTRSFQSRGQSNSFATEMLTGAWGILFALDGVDDIENDEHVQVHIYANGDPIQLSPTREPLEYATYLAQKDSGYHASTTGRIKDGVLTTEPVDVRFIQTVNSMILSRTLDDARLQVNLSAEGKMEGYLSGYTSVDELYNYQFGYRDGKTNDGELASARLRMGSAHGAARVLGYTCNGVYHALREHADGHPDPETGQFTSVSTQYKVEAIPAFVFERNPAEQNGSTKQVEINDEQ